MKKTTLLFWISILISLLTITSQAQDEKNYGLVIHGGAGNIYLGRFNAEQEAEYKNKLKEALEAGYTILENDGTSLDAVEAVINILEDSPLFNAGKGAVFGADGINELDASIMNGEDLQAGAVARLRHIKNPITLARAVMEKSKHVMMVGDGAEKFAEQNGFEFVDTSYFFTKERWESLQRAIEAEKKGQSSINKSDKKYGTVGAVALDKHGNLAAGTSTGGLTNKKYGRVGDSPIIGAGTYADNNTCAVSATGQGEYFIRLNIAHDISAIMEYENKSVQEAGDIVINKKLSDIGGIGGVIIIDKEGNIAMPFNTDGMFRGYHLKDGEATILLYRDDK